VEQAVSQRRARGNCRRDLLAAGDVAGLGTLDLEARFHGPFKLFPTFELQSFFRLLTRRVRPGDFGLGQNFAQGLRQVVDFGLRFAGIADFPEGVVVVVAQVANPVARAMPRIFPAFLLARLAVFGTVLEPVRDRILRRFSIDEPRLPREVAS